MAKKTERYSSNNISTLTSELGVRPMFWQEFLRNLTDQKRWTIEKSLQETNRFKDVFGGSGNEQPLRAPNGVPYIRALSPTPGDSLEVREAKNRLTQHWETEIAADKPRVVINKRTAAGDVNVNVDALQKWRDDFSALQNDVMQGLNRQKGIQDGGGLMVTANNEVPTLNSMRQYKSSQYVLNADDKLFYYNAWNNSITPLNNSEAITPALKTAITGELNGTTSLGKLSENHPALLTAIERETGHQHYDNGSAQNDKPVNKNFQEALIQNPHQLVAQMKYLTNQQIEAVKLQQQGETDTLERLCNDPAFKDDIKAAFSLTDDDQAGLHQVITDFKEGLQRRQNSRLEAITKSATDLVADTRRQVDQEGARIGALRDFIRREDKETSGLWSRIKRRFGADDNAHLGEELQDRELEAAIGQNATGTLAESDAERIKHQAELGSIVNQLSNYASTFRISVDNNEVVINQGEAPQMGIRRAGRSEFQRVLANWDRYFFAVTQALRGTQQKQMKFEANIAGDGLPKEVQEVACATFAAQCIISALAADIPLEKIQANINNRNWASSSLNEKGKPVPGELEKNFPETWAYILWLAKRQRPQETLSDSNQAGEAQDLERAQALQQREGDQRNTYLIEEPQPETSDELVAEQADDAVHLEGGMDQEGLANEERVENDSQLGDQQEHSSQQGVEGALSEQEEEPEHDGSGVFLSNEENEQASEELPQDDAQSIRSNEAAQSTVQSGGSTFTNKPSSVTTKEALMQSRKQSIGTEPLRPTGTTPAAEHEREAESNQNPPKHGM